ncbi:PfkB family carbohydrate kinase [Kribbella sp. NPDC026596]|uniref:PfkB family carbohydrate kinase n=1 Tax=Kribbella sp. NPDC026596 TaxID=3155122 RepID=UPI0033D748A9
MVDRAARAEEWVGAHEVATVDTVGAGDAFCGSLAASIASGTPGRRRPTRQRGRRPVHHRERRRGLRSRPRSRPGPAGRRGPWFAVTVRSFALDRD